MRRPFGLLLLALGAFALGLAIFVVLAGSPARAFTPIFAGVILVSAGAVLARRAPRPPVAPAGEHIEPRSRLPPLITRPMHEPGPGQAPEVRVGMGLSRVWSPDMPLGGYNTTTAIRTPVSWDWEVKTTHTLRFHVDRVISENDLRHAADHACKAATSALAQRGGVKVHGEGHAERGGELLILHLEAHSMNVPDADREKCLAVFRARFEEAIAKHATLVAG